MGIKIRREESDFEVVDAGTYRAEVTDIQEKVLNKRYGPVLQVTFRILEGEFEGIKVNGLVSPVWKPGYKLDRWLKALDIDGEIGEEFDLSNIVGLTCVIKVKVTEHGDQDYSNVEDISEDKAEVKKKSKKVKEEVEEKPKKKKKAVKEVVEEVDEDDEDDGGDDEDDDDEYSW